jgi:hypothetical protein
MSVSALLGTAIGLIFVFALVSLFCSAITESVSNLTEKRARYLLTGLRSMLDQETSNADVTTVQKDQATSIVNAPSADTLHEDAKDVAKTTEAATQVMAPDMTIQPGNLTLGLFGHPLIRSLQTRRVRPRTDGTVRNPQYIPPKLFARALVDTLLPEAIPKGGEPDDKNLLRELDAAVTRLDDRFPAKRSLQALLRQAQGDVRRFESSLEDWYDAEMGRISGWYKRWSKLVLALIGLLIGIVANVDTIQIAHTLYVDEPVRQALVAQATNGTQCQSVTDPAAQRQCVDTQIALLNSRGLPIWYPSGCSFFQWSKLDMCWSWSANQNPEGWRLLWKLLGWALTAFAVSFGAPFWFDALSKLGSLRTTGPKPET